MKNILYDNFTGGALDTAKWTSIGSIDQTSGRLQVTGNGNWDSNGVISKTAFVRRGVNASVSLKVLIPSGSNNALTQLQFSNSVLDKDDNRTLIVLFQNGGIYVGTVGSLTGVGGYSDDVWYTVKYEFVGATGWKVYLNGTQVWTGSTVSNSDYYVGLQAYSLVIYFDDVYYDDPSLSYFNQSSVGDGTSVTSYCDSSAIITAIQSNVADTYFDSTSELSKVDVFYTHEDGRQKKRVTHRVDGTNITGSVLWAPGARDGLWQKSRIIAYDANNAQQELTRSVIGTGEDCSHSANVMTLG